MHNHSLFKNRKILVKTPLALNDQQHKNSCHANLFTYFSRLGAETSFNNYDSHEAHDFSFIFKESGLETSSVCSDFENCLVISGLDNSLYGTLPGMSVLDAVITSAGLIFYKGLMCNRNFQDSFTDKSRYISTDENWYIFAVDMLKKAVIKKLNSNLKYRRIYSGDYTLILAELAADKLFHSLGSKVSPSVFGEYQNYEGHFTFEDGCHGMSGIFSANELIEALDTIFFSEKTSEWRKTLPCLFSEKKFINGMEKALPELAKDNFIKRCQSNDFSSLIEEKSFFESLFKNAKATPVAPCQNPFNLDTMAWVPGRDLMGSLKRSLEYLMNISDNWYQMPGIR